MSFILDALKKSENERQRQIGPSLADIPMRRSRTDRPWWAVAVAALLVINLGVLLVVLLRDRTQPEAAAAAPAPQQTAVAPQPASTPPPAAPTQSSNPNVAMAAPSRRNPAVQSLAEAAGASELSNEPPPYDPSIARAGAVPEGPPVVRQITPPTMTPLPNQPAFAANERGSSVPPEEEEMLPTRESLIAGGTNLPDMRLDIHVFSPNPRERFVFVNMRKYLEGQTLSEGPLLERITSDGAIMNSNGTRFLLPRQ